jgi:hypothetical protein
MRIAVSLWIVLQAGGAWAQDPTPQTPPSPALDLDQDEDRAFVITGSEHLPEFTVLIDRENLSRANDLELKENFLPKIIDAVGRAPF